MDRLRRRMSIASVVGLVGSVLLVAGPIQGGEPLPFRITGSVVSIAGPDDFTGSSVQWATAAQQPADFSFVRYFVVSDQESKDVYSFGLESTDGQPVVATEIAFDPDGHRELLAVGTPTEKSFDSLVAIFNSADSRDSVSAKDPSGSSNAPAALTHGHVFYGTFWTDFVGIPVNDVVDEARFYYDGTHVSSLTGNDGRQWLSANGWHEVSHSISAYYNNLHTLGTISTADHFRTSSWFPLPICGTTDVYYSNNNVYAYPDGHPAGWVYTYQTGTCGFLLSHTSMAFQGT